jgi:2-methylisocitrate lyase-like PEP mutase family enzyme
VVSLSVKSRWLTPPSLAGIFGADCLYAPGIREREHISAVVKAVAPKPVNLLISAPGGLTLKDAAELGVRQVSVGGALARAAWGGLIRAAKELAERGTFDEFANAAPHAELQSSLSEMTRRKSETSAKNLATGRLMV